MGKGWLDNYNDSKVSLPEGYVGEGYSIKGRDYSPAWGGQFQDGGAIYVSSENDPRYKSYADSLYNYNLGNKLKSVVKSIPSLVEVKKGSPYDKNLQKTLMKSKNRGLVDNTKNPNSKSIDPRVQALMKEYQKKGNKGIKPIRYNSFVDNPDNVTKDIITARGFTDLIGLTEARPSGYNIPEWKKPKQKVVVDSKTKQNPKPEAQPNKKLNKDPKKEVVQPDLPRVEAINLPSMQNQLVNFPNQEIDVRTPAQAPTSFDISSQRYNMQGPSDYYNYNEEDVDYETALRAQQAAEKYNTDIEKRYGPQNEYRTEKSRQEAARRLEKLRQDVKVRPNYQMGGSVYPVNYVPEAQMGASIPGAVGFTYARTQSPAPSNGKYAKKTKASAQDGAKVDMHGSPITAIEKHRYDVSRSYYNPRTNQMILGADYAASDNKDKMIAHENYHAKQHSEGRDNFDIGHNTENRQWAEMQKRPQMMSTPEVWNNFYNRKAIESDMAISRIAEGLPESQFFRDAAGDIIYNKIVDPTQYNIPYSFEGEAQFYEDTGKEFKNGGWLNKYKEGGVIKDDRGQWAHPGEITEINSNDITMEGVPYDVLGISDEGDVQLMKPGKNYKFKGKKVTEFPMAKNGLRQEQKSLQNLDNLTNFTNYNKPQPGGWLNKYN